MTTTFLLDPRVLDDTVSDSAKDVEIAGDGAGYSVYDGQKRYAFFFNPREQFLPQKLLDLAYHIRHYDDCNLYHYSLASIIVFPSTNQSGKKIPRADWNHLYHVLYARGGFLKGDAETLKNYGIKIKSQ